MQRSPDGQNGKVLSTSWDEQANRYQTQVDTTTPLSQQWQAFNADTAGQRPPIGSDAWGEDQARAWGGLPSYFSNLGDVLSMFPMFRSLLLGNGSDREACALARNNAM